MTIATMKSIPAITILATEIYTRWRNEANYALSPLHSEWVIAWLSLALGALIEREAKALSEKSGAVQLQSRIDFLVTAAERLESQLAGSREAAKEARRERDVFRGQLHGQKHTETKKPDNYEQRLRELKYLTDCQAKLTRKLSDAQAVIESLKEQNRGLRDEMTSLRRKFVSEIPERMTWTMAEQEAILRGE